MKLQTEKWGLITDGNDISFQKCLQKALPSTHTNGNTKTRGKKMKYKNFAKVCAIYRYQTHIT